MLEPAGPGGRQGEGAWAGLEPAPRDFCLLETLLWDPAEGFFLLAGHLERQEASAAVFGFRYDRGAVERALAQAVTGGRGGQRLRVLVSLSGAVRVEVTPWEAAPEAVWKLALAAEPVERRDPFLNHKTTQRGVYERARRGCPAADDVVLYDRDGLVTEVTLANLVVALGGRLVTPAGPGLLPGVFRRHLLEAGEIVEGNVTLEQLRQADRVWCINSLRRWVPAQVGVGSC